MTRLPAEDRREQILAAAREEFLSVGPEGARISRIAERANVNQALLYRFFPSKEAMFEAAVIEPLDRTLTDLLVEVSRQVDVGQAPKVIRTFFRTLLGIFAETFELFSIVLFSDRTSGHEFYRTRIVPFVDHLVDQVNKASNQWRQNQDPAITVPMSVGMCWGVVMDAHFREIEIDLDAAAAQLAAFSTAGIFGATRTD